MSAGSAHPDFFELQEKYNLLSQRCKSQQENLEALQLVFFRILHLIDTQNTLNVIYFILAIANRTCTSTSSYQ